MGCSILVITQYSASKNINLNGIISKYQKATTVLLITYNQFFPSALPLFSFKNVLEWRHQKIDLPIAFFLTYLRKLGHQKFAGTLNGVKTGIEFDIIKTHTNKAARSYLRTSNPAYTKRYPGPILATDLEGRGWI